MNTADVIAAWDKADPAAIHPSRAISEDAYWASGQRQADAIAAVLPRGAKVVDFGCGDGRVAIPLHRHGFTVTGVDTSQAMIDRLAGHEPGVRGIVTPAATGLGGKLRAKQDAAVCLAVLIHHDYAAGAQIVAGLAKAVKPGGLLILDWPTSESPSERQTWLEVTTWNPAKQDAVAAELGLARVDRGLPWPTFITAQRDSA